MSHSITAEEYARIVAEHYEPDLDWDNPAEYDLTDRSQLVGTAAKILARLKWHGFVVQCLDDLVLDEFANSKLARIADRVKREEVDHSGHVDANGEPCGEGPTWKSVLARDVAAILNEKEPSR